MRERKKRLAAPIDSASPAPLQRQSIGQGLGEHHRDIGIDVTPANGLTQGANDGGFIVTAVLAEGACYELIFLESASISGMAGGVGKRVT